MEYPISPANVPLSMLHEFAPAKLNLYLHITGRRPDGYHDLDSLVAFAGIGDEVQLEPAAAFSFTIEGPQAFALTGHPPDGNLVVKAAHSLAALTGNPLNVKLTLFKNLPVASGIGGGSSDAAAALRVLARYWNIGPDDPRLRMAAAEHGQDVPVCLIPENNYITATGTRPAAALPLMHIVLVNPNRGLPTPAVYKMYREQKYSFSAGAQFKESPRDAIELIAGLAARHNDLYQSACDLMPEIKDIIAAIERSGSLLARMSGSGATCFGLYADAENAASAASEISSLHKGWWVASSIIPYNGPPKMG